MTSIADSIINEVITETSAAASSGGTSSSGGTTVTGDSSASVQVTNVVNSNSEGSTSHTIIEKTVDGVKTITEETKEFDPGEPVIVETEVTATSDSTTEKTTAEDGVTVEATSDETGSSTAEAGDESGWSLGSYIAETFSNIVSGVWSFFVR